MLVCMGIGKIFSTGGYECISPKVFLGRPKVMKFVFYHSKLRKQLFLLNYSNSCPLPIRPVTSLGHQGRRRVLWDGPKIFKLCPV